MPEKLLCSTEEYDSIYQGPRPNGSCAQWMIQEYGKPTLRQLFQRSKEGSRLFPQPPRGKSDRLSFSFSS